MRYQSITFPQILGNHPLVQHFRKPFSTRLERRSSTYQSFSANPLNIVNLFTAILLTPFAAIIRYLVRKTRRDDFQLIAKLLIASSGDVCRLAFLTGEHQQLIIIWHLLQCPPGTFRATE